MTKKELAEAILKMLKMNGPTTFFIGPGNNANSLHSLAESHRIKQHNKLMRKTKAELMSIVLGSKEE